MLSKITINLFYQPASIILKLFVMLCLTAMGHYNRGTLVQCVRMDPIIRIRYEVTIKILQNIYQHFKYYIIVVAIMHNFPLAIVDLIAFLLIP